MIKNFLLGLLIVLAATGQAQAGVVGKEITYRAGELEMIATEADFTFHSLSGARHSFTNPDADRLGGEFKMPLAYQEKGDKESWRDTLAFFNRIFSEQGSQAGF